MSKNNYNIYSTFKRIFYAPVVDSIFKVLFGLDEDERIRRSSLSERLGKIDPDYFRQIYKCVYGQFSECYSTVEQGHYNIIRVDSTIVSDLSGRMIDNNR